MIRCFTSEGWGSHSGMTRVQCLLVVNRYSATRTNSSAGAGAAATCLFLPGALSSCDDGFQNGNEQGVDCGGRYTLAPPSFTFRACTSLCSPGIRSRACLSTTKCPSVGVHGTPSLHPYYIPGHCVLVTKRARRQTQRRLQHYTTPAVCLSFQCALPCNSYRQVPCVRLQQQHRQ